MSMIFFKSQDGETNVSLDVESSINVSLPSTVSKSSTMSGESVSDEVIEGNAVITVHGRVTYSKLSSQEKNVNPLEFQEEIQKSRRNRERFTLFVKKDKQSLLQDYENCVISGADITVDKFMDTITVSLTFEQVFVSEAARKAYLAPVSSESAKSNTASTTYKGNATKTQLNKVDGNTSLAYILGESVSGLVDSFSQLNSDSGGTNGTTN